MSVIVLFVSLVAVTWLVLWAVDRSGQNRRPDATPPPPEPPSTRKPQPLDPRKLELQSPRKPAPPSPRKPEPVKPRLQGRCYVVDGDSLVIRRTEIRLFGVDAPEINHPFGNKAKWALIGLCKGKDVRAEVDHIDQYGRTVARCYLPDGRDLSAEMVKLGMAIDWPKFSGGRYREMERPDVRKKLWLADARQKGRMHVWAEWEARQKAGPPGGSVRVGP